MLQQTKPFGGFKLENFFVSNFSIDRKPIDQSEKPLDIKYDPSGVVNEQNLSYTLGLKIQLKDPDGSFKMKISALGFFIFSKDAVLEEMKPILFLNAPAIMFPYIRAFVASVTALSGLDAVHLPVTNLAFLKSEIEKNTTYQLSEVDDI